MSAGRAVKCPLAKGRARHIPDRDPRDIDFWHADLELVGIVCGHSDTGAEGGDFSFCDVDRGDDTVKWCTDRVVGDLRFCCAEFCLRLRHVSVCAIEDCASTFLMPECWNVVVEPRSNSSA